MKKHVNMKLSEWDIEGMIRTLRSGKNVLMAVNDGEVHSGQVDDVMLHIEPYGNWNEIEIGDLVMNGPKSGIHCIVEEIYDSGMVLLRVARSGSREVKELSEIRLRGKPRSRPAKID